MEGKRDAQRLGIGCRLDWQPPRTLKNPNPWRDWGRVKTCLRKQKPRQPSVDQYSMCAGTTKVF